MVQETLDEDEVNQVEERGVTRTFGASPTHNGPLSLGFLAPSSLHCVRVLVAQEPTSHTIAMQPYELTYRRRCVHGHIKDIGFGIHGRRPPAASSWRRSRQ